MMEYVDLHAHSTFSYGDGYGTVSQHVSRLKQLERTHACLTEHGNVSEWVQLEKYCETAGLKPIYGIEIYTAPPFEHPLTHRKCHMILLAMNSVGLQNINRIVTESWKTTGPGGTSKSKFPTVFWPVLREFNEGIIALSGCSDSQLSCVLLGGKSYGDKRLQLRDGDFEKAAQLIRMYQKVFGDRYYLEVQRFPGLERTCVLNPTLAELSKYTGAQLVATSDVHYPFARHNEMQRILHAATRGGTVETVDATWEYDIILTYPKSDSEIWADLEGTGLSGREADSAIKTTAEIASRCDVLLPHARPPKYIAGPRDNDAAQELGTVDIPPEDLLRWKITQGWHKRWNENEHMRNHRDEYAARMKYEYETICAREGFADYFLIVADLVQYAKSIAIAVGPGRGSSVGSLVCYLLSITEIDSCQFPVLFERFLDPTRTDPPDIDVDFDDTRRNELFDYAATKYGGDCVANVGTFTRYLGRSALDDIGRVYRIPKWKIETVKNKLFQRAEGHPRFFDTLKDTYNTFPEVKALIKETPELRYAPMLEGNIRGFGVHAAAMVISGEGIPLDSVCAIYEKTIGGTRGKGSGHRSGNVKSGSSALAGTSGERQGRAIAFDKYDAARIGLLKIDLLSLGTLGMIAEVCKLAGIPLEELYRKPLDDKDVLDLFARGDVLGVFQFEGVTTRRILRQVAPTTFMHLSDVNALARPGGNDREYIANKTAGLEIAYEHPIMQQHLSWTHGVIVYEEQILMILRDLGGFDPGELNRMRKIIHDKLGGTVFNEYYARFVKGCAAQGLSEDIARNVWDTMVNASGYAFNIAHSVSYSHIAYWAAWLKIYVPAEFYAGSLRRCGDDERRKKLITEAERHGVDVYGLSLLQSQGNWTLVREAEDVAPYIVAGFDSVDGLGPKKVESIMNWRKQFVNGVDAFGFPPRWEDMIDIPGIGPKTIANIEDFAMAEDPFNLGQVPQMLNYVRKACESGEFEFPTPTHTSLDLPLDGQLVVFCGVIRGRKYYDAAEQLTKKVIGLEYEDALEQVRDPHLLKYVALYCEDEHGEQVRVSVNRWRFPKFADYIESAKIDRDVCLVQGITSDFQGMSIEARRLVVWESV